MKSEPQYRDEHTPGKSNKLDTIGSYTENLSKISPSESTAPILKARIKAYLSRIVQNRSAIFTFQDVNALIKTQGEDILCVYGRKWSSDGFNMHLNKLSRYKMVS